MKKWIIRISLGAVALIALVVAGGSIYELMGRRQAAREFPPPGKFVDIGGRKMQLDCRGSGNPTVIFESGLDISGSLSWSTVHDEIAKITRACAYSRAGMMWSDPYDAPRNGKSIAEDLHATLMQAGEQGPFVLVGHSLGGPYIMTYTKYFGADVAGLVFVDASHPDQVRRFNAVGTIPEPTLMMLVYKVGANLNWTGVVRAVASTYERMPHWPATVDEAIKAYASTSLGTMLKEKGVIEQTLAEAGTFRQLADRPVFVLTATAPMPDNVVHQLKFTAEQARQWKEVWKALHDEEASWSSVSRHQLVPDAGHYIQFDRPDVVIEAVRWVVDNVRAKRE
jgi:pimeloyl-ACP methyl ester carboxylesterase